ncbi:MAG: hypothetical protein RLZZ621_1341 [Gemmatimonadota bacterium]
MHFTAFYGHTKLAAGPLLEVVRAVAIGRDRPDCAAVLVFEDRTGAQVDLDLRGSIEEIIARYQALEAHASAPAAPAGPEIPRNPGRPRLGVVPREVTLLPQHWEWLAAQPGGASVTIRKLVEQARRAGANDERVRVARETAYRFLYAVGGNLPQFDEVSRALFAGDQPRLESLTADWPRDVRDYLLARLTS